MKVAQYIQADQSRSSLDVRLDTTRYQSARLRVLLHSRSFVRSVLVELAVFHALVPLRAFREAAVLVRRADRLALPVQEVGAVLR